MTMFIRGMQHLSFIQDLAVVMMTAGFVTILFRTLNQPVVLGYIVAGVIIGPHTPPFTFITHEDTIRILAEVGVVFLMFSLGLHFDFKKLREVGRTAAMAGVFEITAMLVLGFAVGRIFGWQTIDCLFLGAMLAISSTTIIVKTLHELGLSTQRFAELIFGILIVEDILAVAVMALLSAIALTHHITAVETVITVGRLALFLALTVGLGLFFIPPIFRFVASHQNNEATLIVTLGLCFSSAMLAMKLGYSSALGAFLMGAILADAKDVPDVPRLIAPLKDMFSAIFFVTVGMMLDPRIIGEYALPIGILSLVVIVGKIATCSLGTRLAGNDWPTSVKVGMGMAQIGEFSFIIAALGLTLKVTSPFLYPIAVTVSVVTIILTPYLIRNADAISRRLTRTPVVDR